MRTPSALILLVGVLCGGAAFAAPPAAGVVSVPWGVLSVSSDSGRERTEIEVSVVSITNTADARPETTWINEKSERVWVAKKRVVKAGAAATLQWTDSRACYQLVESLAALVDLDRPVGGAVVKILDTTSGAGAYRIEATGVSAAKGRPNEVRLTSGAAVPVRTVIDTAIKTWAPCWSDTPPSLSPAL